METVLVLAGMILSLMRNSVASLASLPRWLRYIQPPARPPGTMFSLNLRLGITSTWHAWLKRSSHLWSCMLLCFTGDSSLIYISGHVRATTAGSLSLDNCHPFVYGKLMVSMRWQLKYSRLTWLVVHAQRWYSRLSIDQAKTASRTVRRSFQCSPRKHRWISLIICWTFGFHRRSSLWKTQNGHSHYFCQRCC